MKKSFIAKITVWVIVIFAIVSLAYVYAHKPQSTSIPKMELMEQGQTVTVAEYELKRADLYDAALNLCIEASNGAYVWEHFVSEQNKHIILTYRVPSLEVLLSAISEMDYNGCLSDSFDESLSKFDKAFYEYNKITKIK